MFGVKQKNDATIAALSMGFCGLVLWFVLSERKSVRIGLPTALSQLFLATFGNALCKDVAPIGVFGGVCLQVAARDFQCASVRLGKGLIFDKRRSCRQKQKFFQKIQKCHFRFVIRVSWH